MAQRRLRCLSLPWGYTIVNYQCCPLCLVGISSGLISPKSSRYQVLLWTEVSANPGYLSNNCGNMKSSLMFSTVLILPHLELALICELRIPFSTTFGKISPMTRGAVHYFHFSKLNKQTNKKPSWAMFGFRTWSRPNWHEWASTKSPTSLLQSRLYQWANHVTAPDEHQKGWSGTRSHRIQECLLGTRAVLGHLAKVRKWEWHLSHVWKWGDWTWQHVHRQKSAEGHFTHCERVNEDGSQSGSI